MFKIITDDDVGQVDQDRVDDGPDRAITLIVGLNTVVGDGVGQDDQDRQQHGSTSRCLTIVGSNRRGGRCRERRSGSPAAPSTSTMLVDRHPKTFAGDDARIIFMPMIER